MHIAGHRARIFDSREYETGIAILRHAGLAIQHPFAADLFEPNAKFEAIKEELEKRTGLKRDLLIVAPITLLMEIKAQPTTMTETLARELRDPNLARCLPEEVQFCIDNEFYPGTNYRRHAISASVAITVLGVVTDLYGTLPLIGVAATVLSFSLPGGAKLHGQTLTAQLIASATKCIGQRQSRRQTVERWIRWFDRIFGGPSMGDQAWERSQRDMIDWTKRELYTPWFEGGVMFASGRRWRWFFN